MKINIIGGGVIGLFCAYYLRQEGHEVHIFDQTAMSDGCSYGNAGMVTPSHFVPLAAPGMVAQGIRWMFNSKSPFFIRPRLDFDLMRWMWLFYRSCKPEKAALGMPVLRDFNQMGKKLYRDFFRKTGLDFKLEERGILMLYQTKAREHEEVEGARLANKLGVKAVVLSPKEVQEMEPDVRVNCLGGVFFPGDAHMHPNFLMQHLKRLLASQGVHFHKNTQVTGFEKQGKKITALLSHKGQFAADQFLLAAGSLTGKLVKKLGVKMPLQGGKGYSFTLKNPPIRPKNATIFLEARVAVTPMGDDLRFGGTLELSGHDGKINMNRVRGILESIPKYYPDMQVPLPRQEEVWHGYRPCSPDGLPYIGKLQNLDNVTVATGHAMMGLSLAPATGQMVKAILEEEGFLYEEFEQAFDPNRYA